MDAYLDTVNAEKVALENTIADLANENEQLRAKIDRTKNTQPTSTTDPSGASDVPEISPLISPPESTEDGVPDSPFVEPPANPDLSAPMTTPGEEVQPEEVFPGQSTARASHVGTTMGHSTAPLAAASDSHVTHLHINRAATHGRNTDGKAGDDVLVIGLEPRDQYGRFVPAANPVRIVLLDPKLEGQAARVASWDFDANQVRVGAQYAGDSPMVQLEASWPKRAPKHSRLLLWARYTTRDGRILQTSEKIHISVDGQFSTRWTPRQSEAAARVAAEPSNAPSWSPNRR